MTQAEIDVERIAQAEKFGLSDLVLAAVTGVVTFTVLLLLEFPGLYPGVWEEATVAVWARPAFRLMPGLWVQIAQWVFAGFGLNGGETVLRLLGHLSLALSVFLVYCIIREGLTLMMRTRPQVSPRRKQVVRLASAVGAFSFVLMDPVWTLGQCFIESTLLLFVTLVAIFCYFLFLRKGRIFFAYVGGIFLGLLASESVLGFVLPPVLIFLYLFAVKVMPNLESPFFKPAVMEVGKWHMTFLYFTALIAGIALNCWTFVSHGGTGAIGETLGYLPLAYLLGYWEQITTSAGPIAWLLLIAVCFTPFVVTAIRFPTAADEERFLPYATGLVFLFCGILCVSQATFLPPLWFWTHFPVKSQYLLSLGLFCCAFTIAGSMMTLGVDTMCRNHQRLAKVLYGVDDDELSGPSRSTRMVRRFSIILVPVFLGALMIPGRIKTTTRMMLEIVREAVAETVREANGAKLLFTDGNLDAAIELEGVRQGGKLQCLSLMGGGGKMGSYLRTRSVLGDREDEFAFGFDAGTGLRSWIRDRPEKLKSVAAQMGFDLWKRDGKPLPPMGGFVSLPAGFPDEGERQRGIEAAHRLADRILSVYARRGGIKTCSDREIRKAFIAVQWRLSRMCTYRSEVEDLAARVDSAIAETTLAKSLNDLNPTYRELLQAMERRNDMLMQKLTPREGLQLALVRADFTMGKTYAETILGTDPNNPDANFSLGMYYLQRHQLSMAESYLKRCLIRKPNEPAVYNNLAMIQIEQRKFDAAAENVRKALALAPESAAILDTRKALEAARKKAK